jgi:hypothetical protein
VWVRRGGRGESRRTRRRGGGRRDGIEIKEYEVNEKMDEKNINTKRMSTINNFIINYEWE